MRLLLALAALGLAGPGCGPGTPPPPPPPLASARAPTFDETPAQTVVVFVVDQLASWVLLKYLPDLPDDGIFHRALSQGVFAERVAYAYASTNTAPGHAAIFTGKPPAESGVIANEQIGVEGHRPICDDGKHAVVGRDGIFASPSILRAPTVGDALDGATDGRALVVSLSLKDRAAVLSAGQHADLALWYEYAIPGFTTSTFYGPVPPRVAAWQLSHPLAALLEPWRVSDRDALARIVGPDNAPGEGDWMGFGTTFPHDPAASSNPYSILRLMPQLTERLLDLAYVCAEETGIGKDGTADLLIVSISGTDYAGHTFGPSSWEFFDHLRRADRAMARLITRLEARGPVAALITSDHGVAPLVEQTPGSLRLFPEDVENAAEEAARAALGPTATGCRWVQAFDRPFLLFAAEASTKERALLAEAVIARLAAMPGIHGVYRISEARGWRKDPDPIKRAVGLSITDDAPGDLFVLYAKGAVSDEDRPRGKGTSHGTPWPYDTEVPVVFFGPHIAARRITEVLAQERVAPTISALLGIAPPAGVTASPLPGAKSD